jgi:hypothetical protein
MSYIINKISFVNECQNGDIFISSKFIIDITNKMKDIEIKYYLRLNGPNRSISKKNFSFLNIPILDLDLNNEYYFQDFMKITANELIINTWVGKCKRHMPEFSAGENATYLPFYYEAFKEIYKLLEIPMEPLDFYNPSFNTNNYNEYMNYLTDIRSVYNTISIKKILICNGTPFSANNHTNSINLMLLIPYLINIGFFVKVTHIENIIDPYIHTLYTDNINKFTNNNQISYNLLVNNTNLYQNELIASCSDFILGLASGLFLTTMTDKTTHCKFIILSQDIYRIYNKFNFITITSQNITEILEQLSYSLIM